MTRMGMAVVIALASIAWPCAHAIDIVYSSGDRHSVVAAHELRRCVASLIMLHHMHPNGEQMHHACTTSCTHHPRSVWCRAHTPRSPMSSLSQHLDGHAWADSTMRRRGCDRTPQMQSGSPQMPQSDMQFMAHLHRTFTHTTQHNTLNTGTCIS